MPTCTYEYAHTRNHSKVFSYILKQLPYHMTLRVTQRITVNLWKHAEETSGYYILFIFRSGVCVSVREW